MQANFGIVLYVIAKDAVEGRLADRRGPKGGQGLTKSEIEAQIEAHVGKRPEYSRKLVNEACDYLTRHKYCTLKGGKAFKRYVLHEVYTMPTLVLEKVDAVIVLTVANSVDADGLFKLPDAVHRCSKKLPGVAKEELVTRVKKLSEEIEKVEGYFLPQDAEQGLYEVNSWTVEEERPYLDCVERWGFRMPRPPATAKRRAQLQVVRSTRRAR